MTAQRQKQISIKPMNTRTLSIVVFILTALLFAGCSKEPQPSKSDVEQSLTAQLPAFARVSSFSVEVMQNMGTKVEPVWQSRFRATVKVTSATFTPDGNDPGVVFVRVVKKDGESTELFGKSASTLFAGKWRTALDLEGQPIQALGQPESAFGPQKVIVRGSKAETDYFAEQAEKRRLAILAAEREAEERRLADERANEVRRKMLVNASQLFVGTWRFENGLVTYLADGTKSGNEYGKTFRGTWTIEGDMLVQQTHEIDGKPVEPPFASRLQIVELTRETRKMKDSDGKLWDATRVK